jgi:DNA-binding transcriptional regulator YiaG
MNTTTKQIEFKVYIPNLEGDEVAETVPIQVTISVDPRTGEEILTPESIQLIEDTRLRYMGLLSPQEIKDMRLKLELSQQRMSELLQAGEKSYTRWELGRSRPSRMVNVLLRLIYEGKVFISDLIAQRNQGINWREKVKFRPKFNPPPVPVIQTQPGSSGLGLGFNRRDPPFLQLLNNNFCLN